MYHVLCFCILGETDPLTCKLTTKQIIFIIIKRIIMVYYNFFVSFFSIVLAIISIGNLPTLHSPSELLRSETTITSLKQVQWSMKHQQSDSFKQTTGQSNLFGRVKLLPKLSITAQFLSAVLVVVVHTLSFPVEREIITHFCFYLQIKSLRKTD